MPVSDRKRSKKSGAAERKNREVKFNWSEEEKEEYYRRAEQQLNEAGIDFVGVDRSKFGVIGWNAEQKTVEAVSVSLTGYPYHHFSNKKRGQLKRLGNWQCTDKCKRGSGKPHFMHSRLIYGRDGGKGKKC